MEELKINKAYIYTFNNNEDILIDSKHIKIIPFWQVLLNNAHNYNDINTNKK